MNNDSVIILVLFWGVWILIPALIDGVSSLIHVVTILFKGQDTKGAKCNAPLGQMPVVSIIIPTLNEEENVDECLNFLKTQTYPHKKIEVIVVDNGSTDITRDIVESHLDENANSHLFDDYKRQVIYGGKAYPLKNSL